MTVNHQTGTNSPEKDPLQVLMVFDRLEVGPVKLEPKGLVAPYRLKTGEKIEHTELIYTYEEAVFDPRSPESQNLAAMIAAQVALNYGWFCREIVLNDWLDKTDRRFLRGMAENTACEIFVKKLVEPNPFLVGDAVGLVAVRKKTYLQARLVFAAERRPNHLRPWDTDARRTCVQSSGGKDSLLSFGLLDEMGLDVHPIFVNESGRHWFSALNAYRHFRDTFANTARVWVDADRCFNWVLRQMPFIRREFSAVRADEYPIRLWTVAVFLFGVLPLIRKRGIGRLVIGDEFDTSRRVNTQGIRHYDGLYDQSIWFDDALSDYFQQKGWSICQFSVLRPLSELLIEKILVKRYLHLQEHQTSCHATHKSGERIKPCGKCEKCRRIVGMLMALRKDPTRCGYTEKQIQTCLCDLFKKGVYARASAEAGQLFHMLAQVHTIQLPLDTLPSAKPYPEIMQIRFDPKVSPINGIPSDLRPGLYGIFMEYADGAVERTANRWQNVDPYAHAHFNAHYRFEKRPKDLSKPSTSLRRPRPISGASFDGRMPPCA